MSRDKNVKIIIGSNFGDEGKGLITDYVSSKLDKNNTLAIRFNGGAQASHSVQLKSGERHAFQHFSSATFLNIPTYLSSFFIINPVAYMDELNELKDLSLNPKVYIDENCLLTTPYDVMINQIVEIVRGDSRHGSCGLGINETIIRNKTPDYSIKVKDIINLDNEDLIKLIYTIKEKYIYNRLSDLGVDKKDIPSEYVKYIENNNILLNYVNDLIEILNINEVVDVSIINKYSNLVFEGAQGLLLDQNNEEYFPHLTRSNTGIKNVYQILSEANYKDCNIEAIYITRAYMTRHGAGLFKTELNTAPYNNIVDLTNIPNPYQGTIRYGLLDINELNDRIKKDLNNKSEIGNTSFSLAVTCLDQIDDKAKYIINDEKVENDFEDFLQDIIKTIKADKFYLSFSPTRDNIEEIG